MTPLTRAGDDDSSGPFSWARARAGLDGLPGGGLNIAHEAIDRHAAGPRGERVALRHLDRSGRAHTYTYARLRAETNRFADALARLGVVPGERVFSLTGRIPEWFVAALGALKVGAVVCPLFASFGPEPVRTRLAIGGGRVLVTTDRLYQQKVAPIRAELRDLEHVIVVGDIAPEATLRYTDLLDGADDRVTIPATDPQDLALLHFTSGTTGTPKGAVHAHEAVVVLHETARTVLDLRPDDVYWCTADPGWVTATAYGMIAPLSVGATVVLDEQDVDPERWLGLVRDQGVTVWYTSPTAIRMMMRLGVERARALRSDSLRLVASVGEPLDPRAVTWGTEVLGHPVHDTWWQTETGAIMIANPPDAEIRPGSMGRPVPGIEAAVVTRHDDGSVEEIHEPDVAGELALRAGWPSMFRGYLGADDTYRRCFAGPWYLTGDRASVDADGYYWFHGRADDVISSAGHLIGPTEVENALLEHPAVSEVGVIGVPDPVAGEVVKAIVRPAPGREPDDELRRELLAHARRRLGPAIAPRSIEFRPRLPKTTSGKIARRVLRAKELGLDVGDLSTIEGNDP